MKARHARRLLAGAALALAFGGVEARRLPSWAVDAAGGPAPAVAEGADAVVLLDDWTVEVRGDGGRRARRRLLTRVLTDQGADRTAVTLYAGSFNRFHHVRVWHQDVDGRVSAYREDDGTLLALGDPKILDDTEVLVLHPADVAAGSVVAVEYRLDIAPDLPQELLQVQRDVPVAHCRVTAKAAKGWRMRARVSGGPNPGPAEVAESGVWEFRDLPGLGKAGSPFAPKPPAVTLALDVHPEGGGPAFPDWPATASWVAALFRAAARAGEPARRLAGELPESLDEAVEATGEWVRSLRYFGVEIGWGGWKPRPPETTLRRRFGDCKDKAWLMVTLLRLRGVDAFPVLALAPSDGYVAEDLPGPFRFNHCIVGIRWPGEGGGPSFLDLPGVGRVRLFDSTLPPAFAPDLPDTLLGGFGLPMMEGSPGLVRFPEPDPAANRGDLAGRLTLDEDGAAVFEVERVYRGMLHWELLDEQGEPLPLRTLRERALSPYRRRYGLLEGGEITPTEWEADGAARNLLRWRAPAAARCYGPFRELRLHDLWPSSAVPVPKVGSDTPVYLPFAVAVEETLELEAPGGARAWPPEPFSFRNELGRVELEVSGAGPWRVCRKFRIRVTEVGPEGRDAAQALQDALERANGARWVFRAAGAEPPGEE